MKKETKNSIRGVRSLTVKTIAFVCAVALVLSTAVGGTYAWLLTKTDPVVNTFTFGAIDIELTETDSGDGDNNPNTNTYNLMPGNPVTKDPKVTVLAESEDCWLFVKVDKSENFDQFLEYEIDENWTLVEGQTDVYYQEVTKSDADQNFQVLKDNKVYVKGDVTASMINELTAETYPTLELTAYAVQTSEEIAAAADAWALAESETAETK